MTFPKINYRQYPYMMNIGGEPTSPDEDLTDFVPSGWGTLFKSMLDRINIVLDEHGVPRTVLKVHQIKEKFGGLRFYYNLDLSDVHISNETALSVENGVEDIVEECGVTSEKICVGCGLPAKWLSTGWVLPYCDLCARKAHQQSNERHKTNFDFTKAWVALST